MSTVISTFFAEGGKGKAVISLNRETLEIDYYDDAGHHFFNEDFPDKSMRYVEDAAENWALGYRKLEKVI